jgi:single-strand DNA-binding protein
MNIIQIAGHLGADAETRFTPGGLKVTTLRVAAKTRRRGKKDQNNQSGGEQGQGQGEEGRGDDDTMWWRVTIWGDRFDKMLPYLKKGSGVIVMGEMHKPELWTNRDGQQQISLELTADIIKFSPFGRSGGDRQEGGGSAGQSYGQPQQSHGNSNYGQQQSNFGVEEFSSGQRNAPFAGGGSLYGQNTKSSNSVEEDPPF